uniref:F-box domain-containing protein n=1 Tax=Leersia perrieri TaxID=77586 RepID=A0A0D9WLV6_9ORYZ
MGLLSPKDSPPSITNSEIPQTPNPQFDHSHSPLHLQFQNRSPATEAARSAAGHRRSSPRSGDGHTTGSLQWPLPDLPPELLGLVLHRLPSHADRVRLRSVCRPWRSSSRLVLKLLRPPLPWIVLPDGAVHRLPLPGGDAARRVCAGSDLLLTHNDGMVSLMNPFSSAATTPALDLAAALFGDANSKYLIASRRKRIASLIGKAVVYDHLIAFQINSHKVIVTTGQPHSVAGWRPPVTSFTVDIAVFQGKLYCLTGDTEKRHEELYILSVSGEHPTVSDIKCIHSTPRDEGEVSWFDPHSTEMYVLQRYLVVAGDRLLMVIRWINLPPMFPIDSANVKRTRRFEVFEAVDLSGGCGRWMKVDTLMGHALFVSKSCSKSLNAGAEEDCIYFLHEDTENGMPEDPFLDSGVYNMRDGTITPLLPAIAAARPHAAHGSPCKFKDNYRKALLPDDKHQVSAMASSSSWSDLRPELLDSVLHCLHSLADRIRFRAVCRPWRHIALAQPLPPPMPWLALGNGTFLTIPDGEIHHMDVPENSCCHGSCDNWLHVVHDDGVCSLMNPFTKASVQPNPLADAPHKELQSDARSNMAVMPAASINSTPVLLVSALVYGNIQIGQTTFFSFCQPIIENGPLDCLQLETQISHIAFCHGKLYAVSPDFILYELDFTLHSGGVRPSSWKRMTELSEDLNSWPQDLPLSQMDYYCIRRYLVECDGRLLLVRCWMQIDPFPVESIDLLEIACTLWFDIFEVDFNVQPCQWRRLNTLGRRALFIGSLSLLKNVRMPKRTASISCVTMSGQIHLLMRFVIPVFSI